MFKRLALGIALGALAAMVVSTAAFAAFDIHGFYNWNGQWCTGLFSNGRLLSYWGCG